VASIGGRAGARRERHLQLGLDADDLRNSTARRLASAVLQQRGLADPGLAA
jgi:hypothetical protein